MLTKEERGNIVKEFGGSVKNTGLTEVQAAILTKEIKLLTKHFETHKMDKHSKMGLFKKISTRDSLLRYLRSKSYDRYVELVNKLGIRGIKK